MLLLSSGARAEVIKFNCVRTDYRDARDGILIIDLSRNIMKIQDLPDYRIIKITEDTIEAQSNSDDIYRSLEFKRYTGKLHWLIFDAKQNRSFLDWSYQCSTVKKII
jgi:hypothetical protein